jgi:hypothetical protein
MTERPSVPQPDDEDAYVPTVAEELQDLAEELGFFETNEMREIRAEFAQNNDPEGWQEKIRSYGLLGHQEVEKLKDDEYSRAQIGYTVVIAGIYLTSGRLPEARQDIADAIEYAGFMGYDDVVKELRRLRPSFPPIST